jgi:DNA-3-methyladenine glycosylase II
MTKEALLHLQKDKKLAALIKQVEIKVPKPAKNLYPVLIGSIVSQQLSVKAAATIHSRFLDLFQDKYPHPEKVLKLKDEQMRNAGLSFQKLNYIRNIAKFSQENSFEHKVISKMSDEEIIAHLTQIKGVGKWTVEMLLMFALARPDVMPYDDLGIQNGIKLVYGLKSEGKVLKADMEKISKRWSPYRSYACLYLWKYKDAGKLK